MRDVRFWHLADIGAVSGQCPLLGVKRTCRGPNAMSAFDAVDRAGSAISKCYIDCVESESNQGGETTANLGAEALKKLARTRRRNETRSIRASGEPVWVNASLNACFRLGPVRAEHYGQRLHRRTNRPNK
jgi:hypothetical protein